ncbi:CPBP family intramembrane glutamic endopeptidase [Bacillus sp. CGMCC 1.16607]|uniref:CPBP family intramembrane glutamic endopeptidase n=1 Tax=Bacillus sp. CGMCC 1.16607 TaxID=3351842 RepID=UPI00362D1124
MKIGLFDFRFLLGLILAHVLFFFTFNEPKVFWYIFTASMLLLISFSISQEEIDDKVPLHIYLIIGVLSGFLLFGIFSMGEFLLKLWKINVDVQISKLYRVFSPTLFWHYLSLMLIAVPGEEIFWRGFILKKLLTKIGFWKSIILSSVIYASVNIYTGEWILVLATFIAGLFWGYLYAWKRSIPLVIVSHLVFDLFIFILFPLN